MNKQEIAYLKMLLKHTLIQPADYSYGHSCVQYKYCFSDTGRLANKPYAHALLTNIVGKYEALTFDGKPDYEVVNKEGQEKLDIEKIFDNNFFNINGEITKAVNSIFLFGYACLIVTSEGRLQHIDLGDVFVSKDCEDLLVVDDIQNKEWLGKDFDIIPEGERRQIVYYTAVDGNNYKFIFNPELEELSAAEPTVNNRKRSLLTTGEMPMLAKIAPFLDQYQMLKEKEETATRKLKNIVLATDANIETVKNVLGSDEGLIKVSAYDMARAEQDLTSQQVCWLDNGPVLNNLQGYKEAIRGVLQDIFALVGINDANASAVEDTEETRIQSAHRVSVEQAYWRRVQVRFLTYLKGVLSNWVSVLAGEQILIELSNTTLLERDAKRQQLQQELANIAQLYPQLMQAQSPQELDLLLAIAKASNQEIPADVAQALTALVEQRKQILQDQAQMAQPQMAIQAQSHHLDLAKGQADIRLKQAQADKATAEARVAMEEASLKPQLAEAEIERVKEHAQEALISQAREERIEAQHALPTIANLPRSV